VPLRLVHAVNVSPLAYTSGLGSPESFAEFFEAVESDGRARLAEAETAIRRAHPGLEFDVDLRSADPVPTLIKESGDARLIVLGSRGLGGFTGILAGSTAVALAAHGHCPVAVIRGRTPGAGPPSGGPVVAGVDGSPTSDSALAVAFDEASWRGADLVAVHTWLEFSSDNAYAYARQFLVDWDAIETREREVLAERLAGWQEKYPDVTVRRIVTRDRPVRCLLEHAADAQLLVVGSRGRGGFTGMLLGSTSQALIYHAPCPLLVTRATAPGPPRRS
jgi:nucleotide-binding universal stress UspA family protein